MPRSVRAPAIAAIVALVLVALGGVVLHRSSFDLGVVQAANSLHTGVLGTIGDLVYRGAGPVPAVVGTAVITAIIVVLRRNLAVASTFAVTIAVTWLSSAAVKILVGRPRPALSALPHPPAPQGDASYPSGHEVFVTALAVTAVLVTTSIVLRRIWLVVGIVAVVAVALILVSDGVHYPSDVAASVLWAAGIAPLVGTVWARLVVPRVRPLTARIGPTG